MAVLKNKTQKNFTIISNNVLRDKKLSMKDRGVLCTICSLPDEWKFSISGLSAIVPDGVDAIRKSIFNLESLGYVVRKKTRGKDGKYVSEIEVFTEKRNVIDLPPREIRHGESVADNSTWKNQYGNTIAEKSLQYNKDNKDKSNRIIFNLMMKIILLFFFLIRATKFSLAFYESQIENIESHRGMSQRKKKI